MCQYWIIHRHVVSFHSHDGLLRADTLGSLRDRCCCVLLVNMVTALGVQSLHNIGDWAVVSVPCQARCMPMEILACGVHTSYKFILHTFRSNTHLKRILSSFPIHGKPTTSRMPKTTNNSTLWAQKSEAKKHLTKRRSTRLGSTRPPLTNCIK